MKIFFSTVSKSLTISLIAISLLFILEQVFSFFIAGFSATSFSGALKFSFFLFLLLSGAGLLLALAQAASVSALGLLSKYTTRYFGTLRSNLMVSFAACLMICPYLIFFSTKLFSGAGISAHQSIGLLRFFFPVIAALFFFSVSFGFLHTLHLWVRSFRKRQHLVLSFSALLLLVLLYGANAALYVGQYIFIHQMAFFVMFLLAEVIAMGILFFVQGRSRTFLRTARWSRLPIVCAVVLVSITGFARGGVLLDSKSLSNIYVHSHLGKQFVWIYGFRSEPQTMDANRYTDYLRARDTFTAESAVPSFEGKNFIWILSDAVRADHLPMYGYKRNTSPILANFSKRSFLFLHSYAQGPNTTTSLAAQMTGLYTSSLKNQGGIEKVETVGEAFRKSGYSTWAIVQDFDAAILKGESKDGVGFDEVFSKKRYGAPDIVKKAVSLIRSRAKDEPFFLFAFFYETHGPYDKRAGFDYGDKPVDKYDSEISYVDKHIGQLLNAVDEEGLGDDTVIAISSDHGDELGQHGGWGHQWKVYNCLLHVPFILHLPGVEPRVVNTPIHSIDLFPSIVKLMNLDASASFDGSSFLPFLLSDSAPYSPLVISEAESSEAREVSLTAYPWKMIYHISNSYFSLFNLDNDPLETMDRIDSELEISKNLKDDIFSWLSYRENQATHLEASDPAVAAVIKVLRTFKRDALASLDSISGLEIETNDFNILAKALQSYYSPTVATKLVELSRSDTEKWSISLRGLRILAKRADREIGISTGGDLYDESRTILEALASDDVLDFLYEAASTDHPEHFKPALQVIGLARPHGLRKKVLDLFANAEDPVKKAELLETLGRLGEPSVEEQLLNEYERYIGTSKSLSTLPMVVSYESERSRQYLLSVLKKRPGYGYQMGMEIGKVRNPHMLPVLKKIFTKAGGNKSSSSKRSFMRKSALLHYFSIIGTDNLSSVEKKAIANTIAFDPGLSQYTEVTDTLKSL